jgi:hypothetical protein
MQKIVRDRTFSLFNRVDGVQKVRDTVVIAFGVAIAKFLP